MPPRSERGVRPYEPGTRPANPVPPPPEVINLLNDKYCSPLPANPARCFTLFPQLPVELRLCVWRSYLQRKRLVSITVWPFGEADDATAKAGQDACFYTGRNKLGKVVSGKAYELVTNTDHRLSPLLSVNAEARGAALDYYRLRMPFCAAPGYVSDDARLVYLNPEFDIVHVNPPRQPAQFLRPDEPPTEVQEEVPAQDLFADFLHDCRAFDPRGRGILNLAIGNGSPDSLHLPDGMPSSTSVRPFHPFHPFSVHAHLLPHLLTSTDPDLVAPCALEAFRATLAGLWSLFLYCHVGITGGELLQGDLRLNRSVPLEPAAEDIVFLGTEPRDIALDVDLVSLGPDPRASLWAWRDMEQKLDSPVNAQADVRFLFTAQPIARGVTWRLQTSDGTKAFAKECEASWQTLFSNETVFKNMKSPDEPGQRENTVHAAGFWLLGLDALGPMPENAGPYGFGMSYRWSTDLNVTLTGQHFELGLMGLDP